MERGTIVRVLVTGATGFLGKRCCEILKEKGMQITATGRNLKKGKELEDKGFRFIAADLRKAPELGALVDNYDTIVHCAALSSAWGTPEEFYEANVTATQNLLKLCGKQNTPKIIYISSTSVYFNYSDRFNISEKDELAKPPPSNYTASKILAEKAVAQSPIESIILRPRAIYGPGDQAIIPRLLKASQQGKLPVMGKGKNLVDITYVDNVVEAIYKAIICEQKFHGEIFNITDGEAVYIWDFLKQLFNELELKVPSKKVPYPILYAYAGLCELFCKYITGKEPTLTRYTVALLSKSQTLDISKAEELLNYQAIVNAQEGLRRVVADIKGKL